VVDETDFQLNDRHSFEEFVGLGVMNDIPDATTLAFSDKGFAWPE
jgi:transposase, IS5 family